MSMSKDISKKRDRATTQRIHIRNEVKYRNPHKVQENENPYYHSSPTIASGVYGKHRFRAVMLFGITPWAFIEVPKQGVKDLKPEVIGRGISSVQSKAKGVGKAHSSSGKVWAGWSYDLPTDYSPIDAMRSKGKKWTAKQIVSDIKSVIDASK